MTNTSRSVFESKLLLCIVRHSPFPFPLTKGGLRGVAPRLCFRHQADFRLRKIKRPAISAPSLITIPTLRNARVNQATRRQEA